MAPYVNFLANGTLTDIISFLPEEVTESIRQYAGVPRPRSHMMVNQNASTDPSTPPRHGSCPLLKLSSEVRRHILQEFLPSKDVVVEPSIKGNPKSRTCDLLVLNKKLCGELSEILYEERTFAINVYEGLYSGGVEFLNSGIQRLQYKQAFVASTFKRFEEDEELFGFRRLKRIQINVHPSKDKLSPTNRHDPMLTYFMVSTMLKLLKKDGKCELNYLEICFAESGPNNENVPPVAGRNAIVRGAQYWWNSDLKTPRETSVHGLSNIELILHALQRIDMAHKVKVQLPRSMEHHEKTTLFIASLQQQLSSKGDFAFDEDLDHKLEVAREALDEWIYQLKFGRGVGRDLDVWIDLDELQEEPFDWDAQEVNDLTESEQMQMAIQASLVEAGIRTKANDKIKAKAVTERNARINKKGNDRRTITSHRRVYSRDLQSASRSASSSTQSAQYRTGRIPLGTFSFARPLGGNDANNENLHMSNAGAVSPTSSARSFSPVGTMETSRDIFAEDDVEQEFFRYAPALRPGLRSPTRALQQFPSQGSSTLPSSPSRQASNFRNYARLQNAPAQSSSSSAIAQSTAAHTSSFSSASSVATNQHCQATDLIQDDEDHEMHDEEN